MPNWVFNTLTINGDESSIAAIKAQLNSPFTTYYSDYNGSEYVKREQTYSNPVFAFWNIKSPAPEVFDEYFAMQPIVKSENKNIGTQQWWEDLQAASRVSNHWYDWNHTHWGTKWDVAVGDDDKYPNTQLNTDQPDCLGYSFDTAWSPVDALLVSLSKSYPTLTFAYDYEEEQGWGGSMLFRNGEILEMDEWDIPSSHADFMAQGKDCHCQYDPDYPDSWFVDCPVDTTKYGWDDNEGMWVSKTLAESLDN